MTDLSCFPYLKYHEPRQKQTSHPQCPYWLCFSHSLKLLFIIGLDDYCFPTRI